MKTKILAAVIAVALLSPARADYLIKDGAGTGKTIAAGALNGKILPWSNLVDSFGAVTGTSANPLYMAFSAPQHVVCDSGCAGGGGGSSYTVSFGAAIGALGSPAGFKDASGNFQPLLGDVSAGQWVNIKASVPIAVTGTFWQALQPVSVSGTLPAFASTPTFNLGTLNGAATATLQTTGNTSLASIDGKTPALGQALVGASVPVVLPATQVTALTPPTSVGITGATLTGSSLNVNVTNGGASGGTSSTYGAAFPTTGTAAGMTQGGNMVALTGTSGNLNVQCANCSGSGVSTADGAAFTAGSSIFAGSGGIFQTTATSNPVASGQQGLFQMTANRALFTNLRNASGVELATSAAPIRVDPTGTTTQPVSGSVSLTGTLPAFASAPTVNLGTIGTAATQTTLAAIQTALGSPFQAGGSIANTSFAATQATAANLNATVVGTGTFAVQAAQSGAWNVTNISGTVSLPTGASTSAAQTTAQTSFSSMVTSLASIDTKASAAMPAQGNTTTNIGNVGNIAIPNGGATATGNIAANNTTAVVVKAGAGTLYGVQLAGLGAAPAYLKIYNAASATCGSGTPVKRLMIPAASTAANGAGSNVTFGAVGVNFSTGITYCVTTGIGDSDATAPAASTFLVNLDWN